MQSGVLISLLWPFSSYVDKSVKYATHDQCDVETMVTYPAMQYHHPLTCNKFTLLSDRSTCVRTTCPRLLTKPMMSHESNTPTTDH